MQTVSTVTYEKAQPKPYRASVSVFIPVVFLRHELSYECCGEILGPSWGLDSIAGLRRVNLWEYYETQKEAEIGIQTIIDISRESLHFHCRELRMVFDLALFDSWASGLIE